jgi:mono/diheme cytochrome c family protein
MPRYVLIAPIFCFSLTAASLLHGADAAALWSGKVRRILDENCVKCHGVLEQKGGLELDTPEMVIKGGEDGAVVQPGKPEASALFTSLEKGADPHMPPKKQLSDAERAAVKEWISALPATPVVAVEKALPKVARQFASGEEAISTLITEGWARAGVKPAAAVTDAVWCRRVYLDLAGRIPTQAELAAFVAAPQRDALIDKLLAAPEYAVRMRALWDNFLMNRLTRGNPDGRRKGSGWWTFLEKAFKDNRPWNEVVYDVLCAKPDKAPDRKGASWFLFERKNDYQKIAEAVAPVVYGTKIDCAQCHDHPLAREIKQAHYWGLVAAFNRSKNVDASTAVAESAVGGFMNFTNLKKESQPAVVTLLTGRTLPEVWPGGETKEKDGPELYEDPKAPVQVPKYSRREAFAEAATQDNPLLARAFVNRMWAALTGRGIVNPPDEINERNTPSHPELLEWLAQDFASHNYDTRRVVREILRSRVYALGASDAAPELFAGMKERSLTAEQLARSWRIALSLPPDEEEFRRQVITAMPDVLPREYNATFQQAQFLSGSPTMNALLQAAQGGVIAKLTALPDATTRIREAFQAVYGRTPGADETAQAAAFVNANAAHPADATRDLLWALLTSAEFLAMP